MIKMFDNLPDAILLIKSKSREDNDEGKDLAVSFDLIYCNEHADELYKTKLSKLPSDEVFKAQYQIMSKRCLR
jgi:hypothetical protein